jgi:hypothetical protein
MQNLEKFSLIAQDDGRSHQSNWTTSVSLPCFIDMFQDPSEADIGISGDKKTNSLRIRHYSALVFEGKAQDSLGSGLYFVNRLGCCVVAEPELSLGAHVMNIPGSQAEKLESRILAFVDGYRHLDSSTNQELSVPLLLVETFKEYG